MVLMGFQEGKKLVEKYGIEFAETHFPENETGLKKTLKKLEFPIAMKINSSKISHKTDKGGVKLNIKNEKDALHAFKELKKMPGFKNAVLQEMKKGLELIIGGKLDEQFGPTIIFGLGGIFVETFKDFSLRICPITRKDAKEMVQSLKAYSLIKGARGKKGVDESKIIDYLLKASELMVEEKIKEMDLNPLIGKGKKLVAVDVRIIK